jgi:hypothetical protein
MYGFWARIAVGVFIVGGLAVAQAQSATLPSSQDQRNAGLEQGTWVPAPRPLFSVLGLPVTVNAPVASPYRNGFTDFGGQLNTGRRPVAGFAG